MKSGEVRRLAEAAAVEGADAEVWAAIAQRCSVSAERLHYWDAVLILQAFTAAGVQNRQLFTQIGGVLCSKTSKLAPKQVLDLFAVYEAAGLRLRSLYVELFHTLIRLSRSMYAEELSLTLQALARYGLGNPTVVTHLVQTVRKEIKDFRLRYVCGVAGALGRLQAVPADLLEVLDAQARLEVEVVPVQELLENMQAFPLLEFSWAPYEALNAEELLRRTASFETREDVDQLVDPFQALRFLQARGQLNEPFLLALCQWCLHGVHQPNVRSERRPTSRQLVALHDQCREFGLEDTPALKDAMAYYVESGGGVWGARPSHPLRYKKKRRFFHSPDPLAGVELPELPTRSGLPRVVSEGSQPADLLALPSADEERAVKTWVDGVASDAAVKTAAAIAAAEAKGLTLSKVPDMPRRFKPSGRSPLLDEGTSTVRIRAKSRKGPRPRVRRDWCQKWMRPGGMPEGPLWYHGGWKTRPKYQQGVATTKYMWPGVPPGNVGAKWVLRR